MRFLLVAIAVALSVTPLNSQNEKKNFSGYNNIGNDSYLKIHKKSNSTIRIDTGGAVFLRIFFLTDDDSVFIDVNSEMRLSSYPMKTTPAVYKGDFMDIIQSLNPGDSATFFMSMDSLQKHYPYEFRFDPPHDKMKYLGMSVRIDSFYNADKIVLLAAKATEQYEAEMRELARIDSMELKVYLERNKFPPAPGSNNIWYREIVPGSGKEFAVGDTLKLTYMCHYPDGSPAAYSSGYPEELVYAFGADGYMEGWQLGIAMMRTGGKSVFIVPSSLAGNDGHTLIFEVEILSLKN